MNAVNTDGDRFDDADDDDDDEHGNHDAPLSDLFKSFTNPGHGYSKT